MADIEERSFDFAVRIVKLKDFLFENKKEDEIGRQILRSGTSIGANVAEAEQAWLKDRPRVQHGQHSAMTKEQIMATKDSVERQRLIAENMDLFHIQ